MDLVHEKKLIREQMTAFFKSLSNEDYLMKSKEVSLRFHKLLSDWPEGTWGVFDPFKDEANWKNELDRCSHQLALCEWDMESLEMRFRKDGQIIIPQNLLVPGRAFDLNGNRLGRGKGFYDRYLTNFTGRIVGICFEEQIIEAVPTESFDQRVELILTDQRLITID